VLRTKITEESILLGTDQTSSHAKEGKKEMSEIIWDYLGKKTA